jgi:Rps23 Pro-64 3,4-dihydroxylase Tpa1-like proline 4-hydroxylase
MMIAFDAAVRSATPFLHLRVNEILRREDADRTLFWLQNAAPWKLTVTDFYEQYEFSLLNSPLAGAVERLVEREFIETVASNLERSFEIDRKLELVDVTAHKLTAGQTIRIHNDFIGSDETHRLLIQLNGGWTAEQGGLLMLFGSEMPESLQNVLLPLHCSGFAFEISPASFHAVSSIKAGERYTLVYTFRKCS